MIKTYLKYGFVLFTIVAIACGILAWVNSKTQPLIQENLRIAEENARKNVFPNAKNFQKVENEKFTFFRAFDENDELLGYAFIAQEYGYSSNIQTMVGLNKNMTINKITILSQSETPGLGDNCRKPDFLSSFDNLNKQDLKVDKDGGNIVSITGATITTRTITNSIKKYIELLEAELSGGTL